MITPTMAQAMPTATACFAPSIRLPRMIASVSRPPLMTKFTATSVAIIAMIGQMPYLKKLAVPKPRTTQNTMRNGIEPKPDAMPAPRISTAVSASPTMPGEHRREPVEQHEHEHRERQHQVPLLADRLPRVRALGLRHAR